MQRKIADHNAKTYLNPYHRLAPAVAFRTGGCFGYLNDPEADGISCYMHEKTGKITGFYQGALESKRVAVRLYPDGEIVTVHIDVLTAYKPRPYVKRPRIGRKEALKEGSGEELTLI